MSWRVSREFLRQIGSVTPQAEQRAKAKLRRLPEDAAQIAQQSADSGNWRDANTHVRIALHHGYPLAQAIGILSEAFHKAADLDPNPKRQDELRELAREIERPQQYQD